MKIQSQDKVTILIPAYNEEHSIKDTVSCILALYPEFEILVVDDGSTDNTMKVAIEAGANVWPQPYNMGNGAAIKKGLRTALGEWVIMLDADGQHDPADIARLLELKGKYDMVVCARKRGSNASWHRNIANWFYNSIASYVTCFKIEDLTSGFRMVRRDEAKKFIYLMPNGFSYPTTLTMSYLRSGHSIKYIPIKARKRKGKSKIKLVKDGTRFFLIIARIATLYSPFRVFLPISFIFFITGLCYYFYTFCSIGRFTNMSALLLSTSVIVFMIGLVSEQVTQMRYDRVEE